MQDPQIDRKTSTESQRAPAQFKVAQTNKKNVLNSYRSYTYNWTLAALRKEAVNDPNSYRQSALDLVILQSGGKGYSGISTNVSSVNRVSGRETFDYETEESTPVYNAGEITGYTKEKVRKQGQRDVFFQDKEIGRQLVQGFNQKSPGRFDMYIDNIEIETIMAFSKEGGTTLPTGFKFKVFEPYSINGFIEALHVSAVAAGYTSYAEASFILKLEFVGHPDDQTLFQTSSIVENSTRFFTIKLTGVDVEIGEKGTSYSCSAIPWNDSAFGQANKLRRPITMSGNTVAEILENFAKNLNDQFKTDDQRAKAGAKDSDEYEIKFPVRNETGLDYNQINEIGKSSLQTILRDNAIYKFPDPGRPTQTQTPQQRDAAPEEVKLHPTSGTPPQIQFAENQQINEIIAAVIRDSEYVKNILKEKKFDGNGFIDYFLIKSDVINKEEIDPVSRKPFQKFVYNILPYKIHFSRIPGYAGQKFDPTAITQLSLREYNYIYTGQNVDVLNFRLNFDKLFFEALPVALGNNDQPGARDSAGQPNDSAQQLTGTDLKNEKNDQIGSPTQRQVALDVVTDGANSGQPSNDPYYLLAKNLHSVIIDSKASMIKGEIEIIGDPFFLVTGGIGNYNPKPGPYSGSTSDGEADYLQSEVLITINFRNPIDIQPLDKGGTMYFESEKLPFSGVYRVIRVQSSFVEGNFKQKMEIIRYPGQIIGKVKETSIEEATKDLPKPGAQTIQSTTLGENRGGTAISAASAADLLNRGLPSPGLPGVLSNFVGLGGGLGGGAAGLLNQFSGSVSRGLGSLTGSNSVFGANNPINIDRLASGIRLKASGLFDSLKGNLANASAVAQTDNVLEKSFNVSNTSQAVTDDITSKAKSLLSKISIPGSGIGQGASILVNKVESLSDPSRATNSDVGNADIVNKDLIQSVDLSLVGTQIKNLGTNAISAVKNIGSGASKILSSVGDKISAVTNSTPKDPTAIASKFGIDPAQLSGLGNEFKSKVLTELEDISKKVPEDTNLEIASARGLNLKYIPKDKLENIPATAPYLVAPKPAVDTKFLDEIAKSSGPKGLANAFGVSDVSKISNEFFDTNQAKQLLSSFSSNNPLSKVSGNSNLSDITSLSGKLGEAKNLLSNVSPNLSSVESNLSSIAQKVGDSSKNIRSLNSSVAEKFNSKSSGQSPLDKLFT